MEILKPNQVFFGARNLRSNGPKIWNVLHYHIKTSDNLNSFRSNIYNVGMETIVLAESATYDLKTVDSHKNIILRSFWILPVVGLD